MSRLETHKVWSVETRVRLLQAQVLRNSKQLAVNNLVSLVMESEYSNFFVLDRMLHLLQHGSKSSEALLQLVRIGFLKKIPMAPGYVNSVLIQQASFSGELPALGVPKVFDQALPCEDEAASGFKLSVDECLDWGVELHAMSYPICDKAWGIIIKRIIQLKGPASGRSAFRYLRRKTKLGPNVVIYCQIIHGFIAAGNLQMAEEVFSEMLKENLKVNEVVHGALLNGFVKAKDIAKVQMHLKFQAAVSPSIISVTMLINLAVSTSSSMGLAEQLYANFVGEGGVPDAFLMGTMLLGYYLHRDIVGARRIFDEMERRNMEPNLFSLNILMSIAAVEMDMEKVMLVLDRIVSCGMQPDLRTYHVLMDLFGAQGDVDRVEDLFATLKSKRISPTLYTYNSLILGHIRSGDPAKAFNTYKKLKASGIHPSAFTVGVLFSVISQYQLFQYSDLLLRDIDFYRVDRSHPVLKSNLEQFYHSKSYQNFNPF